MRKSLRILAFVVLCLAAVAGLAILLPGAREGYGWRDLPVLFGNAGAMLALAGVWWLIVGRRARRAAVGWAILAVPATLAITVIVLLLAARFEGARLADAVRIERYTETPIRWPGFDGPVGLDIALTLRHPKGLNERILIMPPEIRMAPSIDIPLERLYATRSGGAGYFKDLYLQEKTGPVTLLKSVLFQRLYPERFAERRFETGGVTALRYHLYPGTIAMLESRDKLCLTNRSAGVPRCAPGVKPETGCLKAGWPQVTKPVYSIGGDLAALWLAVGAYEMTADLGPRLAQSLRRNSFLQNRPDAWRAMQRRLEPAGLMRAGYRICSPGPDTHSVSRVCYCRGAG